MKFPKLFGRTEVKESRVGASLVMTPNQPVWSNRNYAAFASEAYTRNVIAFRSISKIADACASVRWTAWRGEQELVTHPLLELIKRPNPLQSSSDYMRAKIGFFMIAGNGYEERVTNARGQAAELYQLRPDRMAVIPAPNGFPKGYEYRAPNGHKVMFDMEAGEIRHIKTFHPLDDWYGLSPIEPSSYSIDQHNEAQAWLMGLLQNSARPSGALVSSSEQPLSNESFARLKAEIDEQHSGGRNAGRPMLLEGGLSWAAMGMSPVDMEIIEAKNSAARDVALGLGVPPQLLGIPGDNTYSNYQEARLAFWEDTVIPLLDMFADDWSAWLGDPEGVTLKPDYDQVPAIVEKKAAQWEMADSSADLTINERRAMKGYEPLKKGGDVVLIDAGKATLESVLNGGAGLSADDLKALAYGLERK